MEPQVQNQPAYQNRSVDLNAPLTLGQWLGTLAILMLVPIVNIIMLFVWAFGSNVNINKKNFCRAYLVLELILIGIMIVFFIVFGAAILAAISASGGMSY